MRRFLTKLALSILYIVVISFFFSFFPTSIFAQVIPSNIRYYDWSSTQEKNKPEVLGLAVKAQETASPSSITTTPAGSDLLRFKNYLFFGNVTADNPLYIFKRIQEAPQLLLTFDQKQKDKLILSMAGERLFEIEDLASRSKTSNLPIVTADYQRLMSDLNKDLSILKQQGKPVSDLLQTADLESAKHLVLLEKAQVLVPPKTKEAIAKMIDVAQESTDKVADLTNRPAVPPDLAARIAALKAQGLLTQEEANKLVNAKSRSEERSELSKYVEEGIVPESDSLRLNENVKTYFPEDFFAIHETKRFYTLKQLEEQKPDQATLNKIQEFAKNYKTGDLVPADLRKYWGPIVQLEEIQSTIRPDLVDASLFKNNPDDQKKFQEIVERYKPRPDDLAFLNNYLNRNPKMVDNLPPEYERMKNLAEKFGAACGAGSKWVNTNKQSFPMDKQSFSSNNSSDNQTVSGFCVPQGKEIQAASQVQATFSDLGKRNCEGAAVSAKSPDGFCGVFQSNCLPTGWLRVDSCVETQTRSVPPTQKTISCPTNSHFVPLYGSENGYCVPNYTPLAGVEGPTGVTETNCPSGYHRNYQGGGCLADFSEKLTTGSYLPPLSVNPGQYPSPFYPPVQRCRQGQHFVPEPINPSGGYCAPDNYNYQGGETTPMPGTGGIPRTDMGNCKTPGECYDWCKANPGKCSGFNPDGPRPGDYSGTPSRETQEANCRAGGGTCVSWNNGACGCQRPGSVSVCQPPSQGCETGKWWNQQNCSCQTNGSYPSNCAYPSGGCGSGNYWDSGTCQCRLNPSESSTGSTTGGTGSSAASQEAACRAGGGTCVSWNNGACGCQGYQSSSTTTPPSGYGSCGQGLYWNGSACVSSSSPVTTTQSMEDACRSGGCTWSGSACNCPSQSSQTPAPTSEPQTQTPPPATSAPSTTAPSTPQPTP